MLNCCVAGVKISYDLLSSRLLDRLKKYHMSTESKSGYIIRSQIASSYQVSGNLIYQSEYYNLYDTSDGILQIQKSPMISSVIGTILYKDNEALLSILVDDDFDAEYLLAQYATFFHVLQQKDALIVHSSAINYKNRCYLFSAKSGTGKSTHTKMWVDAGYASYVNDDKNIIVLENDRFIVYGNPFSGKHALDNNVSVPLEAIIFISRALTPDIEEIDKLLFYKKLLSQVLLPNPLIDEKKWMMLTQKIINTKVYSLKANLSPLSMQIAKNKLDGDLLEN